MNRSLSIPDAPIDPISSIVAIALDGVFGASEIVLPFSLPVTMALVFFTCAVSVSLIQLFLAHDSLGASIAKGFAMGVLAGIPYPVLGVGTGIVLLGWSRRSSTTKLQK